jgi:hypothetical protein
MKLKITKRDILLFFIGVFTVIVIDTIVNWEENKADFKEGYDAAMEKHSSSN